jgi:hypothetical protein
MKDARSSSLLGVDHCGSAPITPDPDSGAVGEAETDAEVAGEAKYVCASGWDNLARALGRGVTPANADNKFGPGVNCSSV